MARFDPDLMYCECGSCGQPVMLEPGQTAEVLQWAGLNPASLDLGYMIVSEGCPLCSPEEDYYMTRIVRLDDGSSVAGPSPWP
jgi:hypothetical protein